MPMTNALLTLHDPEAAARYCAEGLWRQDTLYTLLAQHSERRSKGFALRDGAQRYRKVSGESVRPSLGAVQHGNDLNNVTLDPIGDNVRRTGNDELPRVRYTTRATDGGRRHQALYRRSNALDHARRRGGVVRGDPLTDVLKPAKIPRRVFEAARRHRGCNSRLYRSSTSSWDRPSPASSSAIPASISPICHSFSSTYAAMASAARYDFERLVLRANASSFALSAASILAVTTVVSAAFTRPSRPRMTHMYTPAPLGSSGGRTRNRHFSAPSARPGSARALRS